MSKSEALDAAAERHYPGIMRRMATVVENRPIGTTQKGEFAMGTYTSRENPVLRAVREDWHAERLPHGELLEVAIRTIHRHPLPNFLAHASADHLEHADKVMHRLLAPWRDE
jgi:hypothetical protein